MHKSLPRLIGIVANAVIFVLIWSLVDYFFSAKSPLDPTGKKILYSCGFGFGAIVMVILGGLSQKQDPDKKAFNVFREYKMLYAFAGCCLIIAVGAFLF